MSESREQQIDSKIKAYLNRAGELISGYRPDRSDYNMRDYNTELRVYLAAKIEVAKMIQAEENRFETPDFTNQIEELRHAVAIYDALRG